MVVVVVVGFSVFISVVVFFSSVVVIGSSVVVVVDIALEGLTHLIFPLTICFLYPLRHRLKQIVEPMKPL